MLSARALRSRLCIAPRASRGLRLHASSLSGAHRPRQPGATAISASPSNSVRSFSDSTPKAYTIPILSPESRGHKRPQNTTLEFLARAGDLPRLIDIIQAASADPQHEFFKALQILSQEGLWDTYLQLVEFCVKKALMDSAMWRDSIHFLLHSPLLRDASLLVLLSIQSGFRPSEEQVALLALRLVEHRMLPEALNLVHQLVTHHVQPPRTIFEPLLNECIACNKPEYAMKLVHTMEATLGNGFVFFLENQELFCRMLSFLVLRKEHDKVIQLTSMRRRVGREHLSESIGAHLALGRVQGAAALVLDAIHAGTSLQNPLLESVLSACRASGDTATVHKIVHSSIYFERVNKNNFAFKIMYCIDELKDRAFAVDLLYWCIDSGLLGSAEDNKLVYRAILNYPVDESAFWDHVKSATPASSSNPLVALLSVVKCAPVEDFPALMGYTRSALADALAYTDKCIAATGQSWKIQTPGPRYDLSLLQDSVLKKIWFNILFCLISRAIEAKQTSNVFHFLNLTFTKETGFFVTDCIKWTVDTDSLERDFRVLLGQIPSSISSHALTHHIAIANLQRLPFSPDEKSGCEVCSRGHVVALEIIENKSLAGRLDDSPLYHLETRLVANMGCKELLRNAAKLAIGESKELTQDPDYSLILCRMADILQANILCGFALDEKEMELGILNLVTAASKYGKKHLALAVMIATAFLRDTRPDSFGAVQLLLRKLIFFLPTLDTSDLIVSLVASSPNQVYLRCLRDIDSVTSILKAFEMQRQCKLGAELFLLVATPMNDLGILLLRSSGCWESFWSMCVLLKTADSTTEVSLLTEEVLNTFLKSRIIFDCALILAIVRHLDGLESYEYIAALLAKLVLGYEQLSSRQIKEFLKEVEMKALIAFLDVLSPKLTGHVEIINANSMLKSLVRHKRLVVKKR